MRHHCNSVFLYLERGQLCLFLSLLVRTLFISRCLSLSQQHCTSHINSAKACSKIVMILLIAEPTSAWSLTSFCPLQDVPKTRLDTYSRHSMWRVHCWVRSGWWRKKSTKDRLALHFTVTRVWTASMQWNTWAYRQQTQEEVKHHMMKISVQPQTGFAARVVNVHNSQSRTTAKVGPVLGATATCAVPVLQPTLMIFWNDGNDM